MFPAGAAGGHADVNLWIPHGPVRCNPKRICASEKGFGGGSGLDALRVPPWRAKAPTAACRDRLPQRCLTERSGIPDNEIAWDGKGCSEPGSGREYLRGF